MFVITTFAIAQVKKTTTGAKAYPSVTIGNQVWMSKNLDVSTFSNGDPIPQAQSIAEWKKASNQKRPAWCYYQVEKYSETKYFGEPDKTKKYGKLYNWYAVSDTRGLAPKGWHIPTLSEWRELLQFVEDNINHVEYNVEHYVANALNSKSGWGTPPIKNYDYNPKYLQGTDLFGFNVLPGGFRSSDANDWGFSAIGEEAIFFINEEPDRYDGRVSIYSIVISDTNYRFDIPDQNSLAGLLGPGEGLSVRCVKAKEYQPTAQDYFNNGNTKFNAKDYNGAIEEFSKAIELSPDSFLCYYYRGNMKGWLKNWNEARIDHEKAWKLVQDQNLYTDPSVKELLYQLGGNFFSSDKEKACYYFNEAVKYGSEGAKEYVKKCNEKKVNDLLISGTTKYNAKDYNGAIEEYTKAIALSPDTFLCYYNRGNAKFSINKLDEAIGDYEKSWKLVKDQNTYDDPNVKDLLYILGYSYLKIQNKESACFYLNEALKYGQVKAKEFVDKNCEKIPETEQPKGWH